MTTSLYGELTPWYALLDAREDHEDEADDYAEAFVETVDGACRTLLELGSGAGHNGFYLGRQFTCTLSDLSEDMLALSRESQPSCEHVQGDMRTLRLDRQFDAVLIHDAIVYMTTRDDLRQALATAFIHTRPGGAAIIAPDCVADGFADFTELHESEDGDRKMRCMSYTWRPDDGQTHYFVDYVFLLREGDETRIVHDRHVEGLFSAAEWEELLREVGYAVTRREREIDEEDLFGYVPYVFLCKRPS